MSVYVCFSVCLFVRGSVFSTTLPIFTKYFIRTYGRGLDLLWWRCDALCTSGFTDYGMFARYVPANIRHEKGVRLK